MAFSSLMTGTPKNPQKPKTFAKIGPKSLSKYAANFCHFDDFPGGGRENDKNPCFWGIFPSFLALGALYPQKGTFWGKNGVKNPPKPPFLCPQKPYLGDGSPVCSFNFLTPLPCI